MDVAEFLRFLQDCLDQDERGARAATGSGWEVGPKFGARDNRVYVKPEGSGIDTIGTCVIWCQVASMPEFRANAAHIARNDPKRVLAEVQAKRDIIALHLPRRVRSSSGLGEDHIEVCRMCQQFPARYPCGTLRALAMAYADRPGYKPDWRPA